MNHRFLVVNNNHVNILGRDLCTKLNLKFAFVNNVNSLSKLNIFDKYKNIIGKLKIGRNFRGRSAREVKEVVDVKMLGDERKERESIRC